MSDKETSVWQVYNDHLVGSNGVFVNVNERKIDMVKPREESIAEVSVKCKTKTEDGLGVLIIGDISKLFILAKFIIDEYKHGNSSFEWEVI